MAAGRRRSGGREEGGLPVAEGQQRASTPGPPAVESESGRRCCWLGRCGCFISGFSFVVVHEVRQACCRFTTGDGWHLRAHQREMRIWNETCLAVSCRGPRTCKRACHESRTRVGHAAAVGVTSLCDGRSQRACQCCWLSPLLHRQTTVCQRCTCSGSTRPLLHSSPHPVLRHVAGLQQVALPGNQPDP